MKKITRLQRFGGSGMSFRYGRSECCTDQNGLGLFVCGKWYKSFVAVLPCYNTTAEEVIRRCIHREMNRLEDQS